MWFLQQPNMATKYSCDLKFLYKFCFIKIKENQVTV